jgi:hypothetical protein
VLATGKYRQKFRKGGDGRLAVIMIVMIVIAVLVFRLLFFGFEALK